MPRFTVTAQELQGAISDLSTSNGEFKSRVSELLTVQQELNGQWQGEANNAFNNAFNNDKGQWDSFARLMDQYIETLQSIKQTYEGAEQTNIGTATTRTY